MMSFVRFVSVLIKWEKMENFYNHKSSFHNMKTSQSFVVRRTGFLNFHFFFSLSLSLSPGCVCIHSVVSFNFIKKEIPSIIAFTKSISLSLSHLCEMKNIIIYCFVSSSSLIDWGLFGTERADAFLVVDVIVRVTPEYATKINDNARCDVKGMRKREKVLKEKRNPAVNESSAWGTNPKLIGANTMNVL